MEKTHRQKILIEHSSDIYQACKAAQAMAGEIGFGKRKTEEILLVVKELGTNLLKHAGGGTLSLADVREGDSRGMEIETTDSGPGICDVEEVMADGVSTTGSLGYGLGTINRLMDELDIASRRGSGSGTRILCRTWLRKASQAMGPCPLLDFAAMTRPHPGMTENGDAFFIKRWDECALAAVIDGLGHGPLAHRAAQKARSYMETHFDLPLSDIFRGVNRTCRGTRGVVMALARIDWAAGRLLLASVGNIEVRVGNSPLPVRAVIRRGIIGVNAPAPVVSEHPWDPALVVVLHSDGLSTRWSWDDFAHLKDAPSADLAKSLFHSLVKKTDDATVLVIRGPAP